MKKYKPIISNTLFVILAIFLFSSCSQNPELQNDKIGVSLTNSEESLWFFQLKSTGQSQQIAPPVFEIDNQEIKGVWQNFDIQSLKLESISVEEFSISGPLVEMPEVNLTLKIRLSKSNEVVRFRYELSSENPHFLTKSSGTDNLKYLSTSLVDYHEVKEIALSEYFEVQHTYGLGEHNVYDKDFQHEKMLNGQIIAAQGKNTSLLINFEHGSQTPDNFLNFHTTKNRGITLTATKGNYYDQQEIVKNGFKTVWMNLGMVEGDINVLANSHRTHVLKHMTINTATRSPYIFYNTWNYQERNQAWNGKPYLASMNYDRIMAEIDVAHEMGIDVFVIDAGWFSKTGDWQASLERFPDDLKDVKAKLTSYGMKMGLWFNSDAAVTSEMLARNKTNIMSYNGHEHEPRPVWETEESYTMCMVSSFGDDFANELIRLAKKYGVTYFKWDAFAQYGCNAVGHGHGNENNSTQERADNYAFQLPLAMARVAGKICSEVPGAIVDFDVTEGARAFGLAFLESGKYFMINNGPYYRSLDDPEYAPGGGMGSNVLVFPGMARAANCRGILPLDKWIPSTLMLTHYLPDDPEYSQWINIGSLILGQNGIWGDLLSLSNDGINRFKEVLENYKKVRNDITLSSPIFYGEIGGTPEIHEKINPENGKGVVVIFNNARKPWSIGGRNPFDYEYTYITENKVDKNIWVNQDAEITFDEKGRSKIKVNFDHSGAKIIFFGVE